MCDFIGGNYTLKGIKKSLFRVERESKRKPQVVFRFDSLHSNTYSKNQSTLITPAKIAKSPKKIAKYPNLTFFENSINK